MKAAATLAVGFVAVRVVYRILFHGADGTGVVLMPLPALRLPPPFAHIVMFGPVTSGGVWDAVAGALPIAAVFLAFGLMNGLFDLSRLFARAARRGPFQGIGRALAIAWATLPALADAVRAVRFAQRLRGERAGARLLAPVLERTLERATAVAAALELRGYAGLGREGDCTRPVEISDASMGFAGPLRIASLRLAPGTLAVLSGSTGAGKTTVLRGLSGLLSHVDGGTVTGEVRVVGLDRQATPPRDTARTVGVVLQHPRDAFATECVADEIGLALELRGVARTIRHARVREIAGRVGITPLLDRPLRGLSAGEATLVAIAAAIVEHPILLLVDEPLADLDRTARARIVALLGALAHDAGMCVVVAEHRVAEFDDVADRSLRVEDGRLLVSHRVQDDAARAGDPGARRPPILHTGRRPALTARGITVRHGARLAVDGAGLDLRAGEIVALSGPNGAGKSTLLQALALPGRDHDVRIDGAAPASRAIALVPDASDDLFVRDTVTAECRRADRHPRGAGPSTADRFAELLGLDPTGAAFAAVRMRHPRDLSAGQRRTLAIAIQTASAPRVLLIDEPTRGLDPQARALVAAAIEAQASAGTAVLIATHDAEFAAMLASRHLAMDAGILTPTTRSPEAPRPQPTRSPVANSALTPHIATG
ncbi:ATP-binding cassette domain-containing protein, partial [Microbacterium sp.]|uniref:ATP-binding cassette domain-containing protein n=1 Tax=Microbacterium sp. TaxID=51671 RepID=UPI0025F2D1A6